MNKATSDQMFSFTKLGHNCGVASCSEEDRPHGGILYIFIYLFPMKYFFSWLLKRQITGISIFILGVFEI